MASEKITPGNQKKISIIKDRIAQITKVNNKASTISNLSLKNVKFNSNDEINTIMDLINYAGAKGKFIINTKVPSTVRKAVIEKFKSRGHFIIASKNDITNLWISWVGSNKYFYVKSGGKSSVKPTPEFRAKEIKDYITRESGLAIEKQLWINPATVGIELFPSDEKLDKIAKKL
jgi:archaellum biogenesis ATPase FlaH